jgi:protein gp37
MGKSKIEWCDKTWGVVTGCTPVSAGCQNCWAAAMAKRFPKLHTTSGGCSPHGGELLLPKFSDVLVHPDRLDQPLHWKKPRIIFVAPMGDLFHPEIVRGGELPGGFLYQVWATMAKCYAECIDHKFLILTKRPEAMQDLLLYWQKHNFSWPGVLPNVWLGVSVEDQPTWDERVSILQETPAAHRLVSVEPMLGPVDPAFRFLDAILAEANEGKHADIDWVIAGAESGPRRRFCEDRWLIDLAHQCEKAKVPYFCKQSHDLGGQILKMPELVESVGHDIVTRVWDQTPWGGEVDG